MHLCRSQEPQSSQHRAAFTNVLRHPEARYRIAKVLSYKHYMAYSICITAFRNSKKLNSTLYMGTGYIADIAIAEATRLHHARDVRCQCLPEPLAQSSRDRHAMKYLLVLSSIKTYLGTHIDHQSVIGIQLPLDTHGMMH